MKKKILIVGNSKAIKNICTLLYNRKMNLSYLNFRKAWNSRKIKKYDLIILTGFHFRICHISMKQINDYIKEYNNFILKLKKNCKELILITTYLNIRYSFCRVVYFYYNLLNQNKMLKNKNIKVYNFKKILPSNLFLNKYFKSFLLFFNFEFADNVANNFEKFRHKKLISIKFYFINIPRTRFLDRILRVL